MADAVREADDGEIDAHDLEVLESLSRLSAFVRKQVEWQETRSRKRLTINRWLDENENEWNILDGMCRSRPWATRKDEPFPYPFREATQQMREVGERLWVGDTEESLAEESRPSVRGGGPSEVLTNILPTQEYPPLQRLLLFTPEFGDANSYSTDAWSTLRPEGQVDVWVVTWQGWRNFNDMIREVYHWVATFADGVSTVWYGHSMGAIVMYECLRLMHEHLAPCLPVALFVSGCPAPHLFQEVYKPRDVYPWLRRLKIGYDFEKLTPEQHEILQRDFSMALEPDLEENVQAQLYYDIQPQALGQWQAAGKLVGVPKVRPAQQRAVISDFELIRSYAFAEHDGKAKAVLVPLFAVSSDEDELVSQDSVAAWAAYTDAAFEVVQLGDHEDSEVLAALGHGFARSPPPALRAKIEQVSAEYQIKKDIDDPTMLPDIGPVDGPLLEEVDVVIVGAGITGVCTARDFVSNGLSVLLLDRQDAVGGIWKSYANVYSRVNTSEVGYRIVDQEGPTARPNQDHSPTHDIMRDIYTVCARYAYGRVRCAWNVIKTEKQPDESWLVTVEGTRGQGQRQIRCKFVMFAVNRRIGKRRDVAFKDEHLFRGDICYGYANELKHLNFSGKRVIVVGAGAFAYENLRTAVEHGARFTTILGRRAGTTCPKWIDMIAFLRPADEYYMTGKPGNIVSFEVWKKCYEEAGLRLPDCWAEGLLKPHNHTVSVSDLAYIAGYHGMADLKVGEIDRFHEDGQRVVLKDGSKLECDIVIKCTGFLLNEEVPNITGKTHMFPSGLVDFNMAYLAEPLLDGGQFGSLKGGVDSSDIKSTAFEVVLRNNPKKLAKVPQHILAELTPRGNPFGSGYAGGLLSQSMFVAWLAANPDKQKHVLEGAGKPRMHCVQYWASQLAVGSAEEFKDVLARACSRT